jgi:riboflavin synthase
MFTGLIESIGIVQSLKPQGEQAKLTVDIAFADELKLGDSVAINGCCLTVTNIQKTNVDFDVLTQTLRVTSLENLFPNSIVNLERALLPTTRLGGHFVQGHVDTIGKILDLSIQGQDHRLEIFLPKEIHRLCIPKGSIAIDGISLTIAELLEKSAVFWITPHTFANTHLKSATLNQSVNLEADLLAKYIYQFTKVSP